MSKGGFTASFTIPVGKLLEKKATDLLRKEVQDDPGQVIILDPSTIDELRKAIGSAGYDIGPEETRRALNKGIIVAERLHREYINSTGATRFKQLEDKWPSINFKRAGVVLGKNAFLVKSFGPSISAVKNAILDSLQDQYDWEDDERADVSGRVHKGHGEEGLAISQVKAAQIFARAGRVDGGARALEHNLEAYIQTAKIPKETKASHLKVLREIVTKYNQIVTPNGKLQANYFSLITFQDGAANLLEGQLEKAFLKVIRDYVKDKGPKLVDIPGSNTIKENIEASIMEEFTTKGKNKKVTKNIKKRTSSKGESKKTYAKQSRDKALLRRPKKAYVKVDRAKTQERRPNPLSLLALINEALPKNVIRNMGAPSLVNRTGAFAASVRATDIITTPAGYPSIGYTYEKNPYQVFEMGQGGSRWATPERDPRTIIDRSLREVATTLITGRFYTRRV